MTNFKFQQNSVNQIYSTMLIFSSFWQMLHDVTMLFTKYLQILNHLQAIQMMFLKLFLICTFKDQNLAEKLTNVEENIFKNWTPRSSWSLFSKNRPSGPMLFISQNVRLSVRLFVRVSANVDKRERRGGLPMWIIFYFYFIILL